MKKFIYALALSVFTLSAAAGCSAQTAQENTQDTSQETVVEGTVEETVEGTDEKAEESGAASPMDSIDENIAMMVEPADAVLRCMVENNLDYAPDDDTFFWRTLYYFAGTYGGNDPGADFDPMTGELTLSGDTMMEYGSVLRAGLEELPKVPKALSSNVVTNDDGSYTLFTGDVGLAYSFISDLKDNGDGTYDVTVELRGTVEDDLIASGVFTIEENEYVLSLNDPQYVYTITAMNGYTRG